MQPIEPTERPSPAISAPASSPAPAGAGRGVGTLHAKCGVVAVDHSAFLVHFLREAKLVKTVGQGHELIKAVHAHLAVDDSVSVSNPGGVDRVGLTQSAFERGFNRGNDFAVVAGSGGLWDQAGGLAHEEVTPAHQRAFRYVALYLRKLAEHQTVDA